MRSYTRKRGRPTYRRRYKRRKTGGVSKTIWKASKRAAKAQVYKMSETKRLHYVSNVQGIGTLNFDLTAFNPFQPFTTGTLQSNVIGNEIDVRYFEIRYKLIHTATQQDTLSPLVMRVTLVRTPVVWPLDSPSLPYIGASSIPSIFIGNGNTRENFKFDSNQVKVLGRKTVTLHGKTGNTNAATNYRFGRIKFRKLKGKKTFMTTGSASPSTAVGRIRQGQYYILIELMAGNNTSGTNNYSVQYDWSMYYKDM